MNTEECIKILSEHNRWRRGEMDIEVDVAYPALLGEAIDYAVERLKAGQWHDIKNAPRDGTFVLTWHKDDGRPEISRFVNVAWTKWAIEPSHWQPLQPPESEGL